MKGVDHIDAILKIIVCIKIDESCRWKDPCVQQQLAQLNACPFTHGCPSLFASMSCDLCTGGHALQRAERI